MRMEPSPAPVPPKSEPIVVKAVSQEKYDAWLEGAKTEFAADASDYLPAAPVRLAQAN